MWYFFPARNFVEMLAQEEHEIDPAEHLFVTCKIMLGTSSTTFFISNFYVATEGRHVSNESLTEESEKNNKNESTWL